MSTVLEWFSHRPLRLIGGLLVFLSASLLVFLVLLDILVGLTNPYLGILTYMLLPGVLVFGLILVPLDSLIQRRRAAAGLQQYPVIDLCDVRQRRIALFFGIATVGLLIVLTVVTYKSIEYMDTNAFCGQLCHKVMIPEYTVYLDSPHAGVRCIACHIGPGAPWFVRSKLSGVPQVYHYTKGDYPRPLETPVRALRPSRDTCENCHWPEEFYGSMLRTTLTYEQDRENTRVAESMILHVGSGGVPGSGIHSHMVSSIHYLPADEDFAEIAWVRVKRPNGSTEEFSNPGYKQTLAELREEHDTRFMDCIDCHNRAAHHFDTFENNLDHAITRRRVDPTLPFIKQRAMAEVGDTEEVQSESEKSRTRQKIRSIPDWYKENQPEVYEKRSGDITEAVRALEEVYDETFYDHMRVGPRTYVDWKSHDGCFRCHGVLESSRRPGEVLEAGCSLCHTEQTTADPADLLAGR